MKVASRIAYPATRIPHRVSRISHRVSRIAYPVSRIAYPASRISFYDKYSNKNSSHGTQRMPFIFRRSLPR